MLAWPNQRVGFWFEDERRICRSESKSEVFFYPHRNLKSHHYDNEVLENQVNSDDYKNNNDEMNESNTHLKSIRRFVSKCRFMTQRNDLICATRFNGYIYTFKYDSVQKIINQTQMFPIGLKNPLLDFQMDKCTESVAYISTMSGKIFSFNFDKNLEICIGKHDNLIVSLYFIKDHNLLVSAGLDSYLKLWDLRSNFQTTLEINKIKQSSKIYAMDGNQTCILIGTADNHVSYWDIRYHKKPLLNIRTSIKSQIRCIKLMCNDFGHIIGTNDGKIYVEYLDKISPANLNSTIFNSNSNSSSHEYKFSSEDLVNKSEDQSIDNYFNNSCISNVSAINDDKKKEIDIFERNKVKGYSFRCHHKQITNPDFISKELNHNDFDQKFSPTIDIIYGVNDISINPINNSFATCGSDGTVVLWSYELRKKLGLFRPSKCGVYSIDFSSDGQQIVGSTNSVHFDSYSTSKSDHVLPHSLFIHQIDSQNSKN